MYFFLVQFWYISMFLGLYPLLDFSICWQIIVHNKTGLRTVAALSGHNGSEFTSRKGVGFIAMAVWPWQWGFRAKTWDPGERHRTVAALVPNMLRCHGVPICDSGTQQVLGPLRASPSATIATAPSPRSECTGGTLGSSISWDQYWWTLWKISGQRLQMSTVVSLNWDFPAFLFAVG